MEQYRKQANATKQNHIFKVIILGDCSVGKTTLIQNYIRKQVSQQYKPTIGADFHSKKLYIKTPDSEEPKSVTLQIWDTAGQERYQSLGQAFYRGSEACILVYDITSQTSFQSLWKWRTNFLDKAMPKDAGIFPFFVLGNKKDLEENRQVHSKDVKEWVEQFPEPIPHEETSAVEGENVEQAFLNIATSLLIRQLEGLKEKKELQVLDYSQYQQCAGVQNKIKTINVSVIIGPETFGHLLQLLQIVYEQDKAQYGHWNAFYSFKRLFYFRKFANQFSSGTVKTGILTEICAKSKKINNMRLCS